MTDYEKDVGDGWGCVLQPTHAGLCKSSETDTDDETLQAIKDARYSKAIQASLARQNDFYKENQR